LAFSNFQGYCCLGGFAGATAEFNTEGKCKAAGLRWEASIMKYDSKIKDAAKWICVEK
jgi:hypothetical protein